MNLRKFFILLWLLVITLATQAQNALPRKGYLGIKASDLTDETAISQGLKVTLGVIVDKIAPRSTADRLQLLQGDIITQINLKEVNNLNDLGKITNALRENDKIRVQIWREGQNMVLAGNVLAKPLETDSLTDVIYGQARTKQGGTIRTILNKPRRLGQIPVIVLVTDYACTPIEQLPSTQYGLLIKDWCAEGFAVMRVEKSGLGDNLSTPDCDQADWKTEAAGYEAGLKAVRQYDFVDTNAIFVFGHGIGGTIAPYIAQKQRAAGLIVYGTTFQTWFEFLLKMYRFQNGLRSLDFEDSDKQLRTLRQFLDEWLSQKKSVTLLAKNPQYKTLLTNELLNTPNTKMVWGRHEKFWQQLDSLPLATAWRKAQTPVLSIWGAFDTQAFEQDHLCMAQHLHQNGIVGSEYIRLDSSNHYFIKTNTIEEGQMLMQSRNSQMMHTMFNPKVINVTTAWIRKRTSK
ncbi:hypothetical protein SAMN05421780_11231 [Flexibacter flexilis DSM 6793]|uniref:PDZ domain-containing protein n=1 Tax=Flexibacter flexilis DSM 6793 TaxID=927664 RepID=A0A1I1N2B1_9BACT|nr:PDZ domain-containing protein [Flexibacter flexilis]SFC91486.1 hypothetical protein SAMN05421780_11231 [Flexibacter flexilis DSM 6793]